MCTLTATQLNPIVAVPRSRGVTQGRAIMATKGENLQDSHNKGQSDASKGEGYNAPHSVTRGVVDAFVGTKSEKESHVAENEAYKQGYDNAKDQKK